MEMKRCTTCGKIKTIDEFAKRNGGAYGAVCKSCSAEKQRVWYDQHRAEISLQRKIRKLEEYAQTKGFTLEIKYEKHN